MHHKQHQQPTCTHTQQIHFLSLMHAQGRTNATPSLPTMTQTSTQTSTQTNTCEVVHPCRAPQQVIIEASAVEGHQGTALVVVLGPLTERGCCHCCVAADQTLGIQRAACVCEACCVGSKPCCCLQHMTCIHQHFAHDTAVAQMQKAHCHDSRYVLCKVSCHDSGPIPCKMSCSCLHIERLKKHPGCSGIQSARMEFSPQCIVLQQRC